MDVAVKVALKFLKQGELLDGFIKSLTEGRISIPSTKRLAAGTEIELEVHFPQIDQPQTIPAVVVAEEPDGRAFVAQPVDIRKLDSLFKMLAKAPAEERSASRLEIEMIEQPEDEPPEESGDEGAPLVVIRELAKAGGEKKKLGKMGKTSSNAQVIKRPVEESMAVKERRSWDGTEPAAAADEDTEVIIRKKD